MTKRRVCLECGTPKMPRSERCRVCAAATITHLGEARQSICNRCTNAVHYTDGTLDCGWTRKNDPSWKLANRTLDTALDMGVDYYYACRDFNQRWDRQQPSPNPLSDEEREYLRSYYLFDAFWHDPDLWEGVDPHKEDVWVRQAARSRRQPNRLVMAGAIAATLGLLLLKGKTNESA